VGGSRWDQSSYAHIKLSIFLLATKGKRKLGNFPSGGAGRVRPILEDGESRRWVRTSI